MFRQSSCAAAVPAVLGVFPFPAAGAQAIPAPADFFGFESGTNGNLADWGQLTASFEALAKASPRVSVDPLGTSTRGLPFVLAARYASLTLCGSPVGLWGSTLRGGLPCFRPGSGRVPWSCSASSPTGGGGR